MPVYDFRCDDCDERFEAMVAVGATKPCPRCGSEQVERVYVPFAGPFRIGLRGAAARRSNAVRAAREEQRRERRELRRQARESGEPPPPSARPRPRPGGDPS